MLALIALAVHFQLKFKTAVPASRTSKIGAMYVCD